MRYDRAVGRQAQPEGMTLGRTFIERVGFVKARRLQQAPTMRQYFNAGVNVAYGGRRKFGFASGAPSRGRAWGTWGIPDKKRVSVAAFDRAGVHVAYGNPEGARAELGDLFNDIMGAVVPGWDQRSDALKNIKLQVDPNKVLQAANKIAPGAGAQAVKAANAAGLDVYVDTPGGRVLVTPDMAQGIYKGYPMYTRAQSMIGGFFGAVPGWVWLAGAGGAVLVFGMSRR